MPISLKIRERKTSTHIVGQKPSWILLGVRAGLFLLVLLGAWFDFSLWNVTSEANSYQLPAQAEVIIILGCGPEASGAPSLCQKGRVGAALELWRKGYAPYIILTGGGNEGGASEAHFMAEVALEGGVPADRLLLEETW